MSIQKPKGTQDIIPGQVEKWQRLEKLAGNICRRFGYREIRSPIFEHTELFSRGVGETTDIVEKEMYTFEDKGKRNISLRPEGTAGVVRAYIENKLYGEPDLTKLYYFGPMFRYEQPQSGRNRQFHQFGVEAIGSADPGLDAEAIALGFTFLREIGLKDVRIEINSVGTPAVRSVYREKIREFFAPVKDKLCKDCQSRYDRNPMRILDCKIDQKYGEGAPSILDYLDGECSVHFETVKSMLTDMEIPFDVNHRMVRGLDYYTHTAFEYKAAGIGAIDTVGGGGRYNGLVGEIGGQDQPGVGFALGVERILLLLEAQGVEFAKPESLDLYVIGLGEAAERAIVKLVHQLRLEGLSTEKDYQGRKIKAQMKSADRLHAAYVAILGDDELERGEITVKHMATGEQETLPLEGFSQAMKKKINKATTGE
ncbi:histidine--tRNA ligase HisS [Paenibacillus larvae subsp. larvae]|uniref:Histidine--tRNA ligase n=1 Tax=Paenibacillus larvae subsp. larvae TaxID=147375 RepID=A0A2L1U3I1_9BACL|nr:histidine--tRNA ligase [Paenibacillus larvae]AQT84027.1 histidine--tRNA ligase [Paenibacillus larvae subsp. pulvifaciens]AQZ45489.1 histidine--tRNA ligase [Paenibacillus larvae subsp. pulvifaciens]AVF27464.1 histidine--tRNA ligase HisS [Paenibacillus larvae subsp. larvae]AVF32127.1 histidine--tRNA ligase HisS [Paenibacillus larvae subsp. larvae]MBH0344953.1 histidyl-tRNA synthetase [Paenibacillus larvae]